MINKTDLEHILAALVRMEHKTTGSMYRDEYLATMLLAREVEAPQFIIEYFARKTEQATE